MIATKRKSTMLSGADISEDGLYRYRLWRDWTRDALFPWKGLAWIMLNPSTADHTQDDPTIRRVVNFSMLWGYGSCHVINLFAYRATDSKRMIAAPDPIGPQNDEIIALYRSWPIIAAWGAQGRLWERDKAVLRILRGSNIKVLGLNRDGTPVHPLYQPRIIKPSEWRCF